MKILRNDALSNIARERKRYHGVLRKITDKMATPMPYIIAKITNRSNFELDSQYFPPPALALSKIHNSTKGSTRIHIFTETCINYAMLITSINNRNH